jgi:hypothetical protein
VISYLRTVRRDDLGSDMSDQSSPPSRQELREAIVAWLRRQSAGDRFAVLDRPFVVTLIGGIFLAVLAHVWDANEKERERELTYQRALIGEQQVLLKEFGTVYQNTVSTINSWFARVVWIADERNKKRSTETATNIKAWKGQTQKLEERYSATVPLDVTLIRVRVLYSCKSVRDAASEMLTLWQTFLDAFQSFNRKWNDKQTVPNDAIRKNEESRRQILNQLETLEYRLVEKMAGELAGAKDKDNRCPP